MSLGRYTRALLLAMALLFGLHAPSASQTEADRYVAKAGDQFISEQEFLERFELLPARGRKGRVEEAKMELLYSMIAERLLAAEASQRGIEMDSSFAAAYDEVRKLLARDQLYRQEIGAGVTITEEEIAGGMERARKRLLIHYLFFSEEGDATFIRKRVNSAEDVRNLQLDSTMNALHDTVSLDWGAAEPAIEQAAFALAPGEVSPVVAAGEGWYILWLTGATGNPTYNALDLPTLRARVQGVLRLRKENERLNAFMPEFLKNKSSFAVGRTFVPFTSALRSTLEEVSARDSVLFISPELSIPLKEKCREILEDTLMVAGARRWTVGDAIDRLAARSFRVQRSDLPHLPQRMSALFRHWAEQELLAQEAIRRGLDRVPAVSRQLDMWRQFYLADAMKERLGNAVTVTESEAWSYLRTKDSSVNIPVVQVRELRTGTLEEMEAAMAELDGGSTFADVVARWSVDSVARDNGGLTPPFAISERIPLGDLAWNMEPGQRYGPIPLRGGQLLLELVRKDMGRPPADTSGPTGRKQAEQDLLAMKRRRIVTLYLAQLAQEQGFTVFEERVRALKVSAAPMMTYRILGFGGRVFAVPFVDRQLDWLEVKPPEQKILP